MHVDVILKVFRGRRWVDEAIASVKAQTHPDWTLTVVDDACPEETGRYIEERYADDGRVRVIYLDRNRGPLGAQIEGIQATTAEAVAFIDQDDRWHAEKLALQVARLGAAPAVQAVHTDVRHIDAGGSEIPGSADRENARRAAIDYASLAPRDLARSLFREYSLRVVTTLSLRRALVASGSLDRSPLTDTVFWARFAATGHRMAHIPRPLVDRRVHPGQFSRGRAGRLRAHLEATDLLAKEFPDLFGELAPARKRRLLTEQVGLALRVGEGRRTREALRELQALGGRRGSLAGAWLVSWMGPFQRVAARLYRRFS